MAPARERDRAREGQHDLGLHALACFLAATALNPWRFDAISAPGCFASACIAIRYCKQSVSKPVLSSLSCVSRLLGCCLLSSSSSAWNPYSPSLCICLASRTIGPRPRPAPCSPEPRASSVSHSPKPRASSAPRSLGSRASSNPYPPVFVRQTRACLQTGSVRKPPSLK